MVNNSPRSRDVRPPKHPWIKKIGKVVLGAVLLLVLLLLLGMIYQVVGAWSDQHRYPPPGQLIAANGTQMHIYCQGEGSPTVILESLAGGFSSYWGWVQPEIAKTTRVCAYDRVGYGWSEGDVSSADLWRTVDNLHNLLQESEIDGPYLFVGHSIGGLYARAFAARHPDEVIGMVLLDAAHPEQFDRHPEYTAESENHRKLVRIFPQLARMGLFRLYFALGGEIDFADLAPRQHDEIAAFWSSPDYFESQYEGLLIFSNTFKQAHELQYLDDLPLVVVSAGTNTADGWDELQEELADLSTNSGHIVLQDATHVSLVFNPDHAQQVSTAVLQLISQLR